MAGRTALTEARHSTSHRSDGQKRLVCFDIPERDRAKRRWLRGELIASDYHQLQKSVWIGKTPLPQEFIEALDTLELRGRVHLLRVGSEGTLRSK
jgi:DNA-binding transcriptional regulator PaaX